MTTPGEMSTQQLVDALMAEGMSKKQIADAVGRNSSVISQITSGKKPYANLRDSLAATLQNRRGGSVPVPQAPRRRAASGQLAQVRKPTAGGRTVHVRSAGAIKGGAKSIARRLAAAARAGQVVGWSVTYPPGVQVGKSPPRDGSRHAVHAQTAEVGNHGRGYPAAEFHQLVQDAGGNVGQALTDWLVSQNMLSTDRHLPVAIELRVWTPKP